MHREDAVALCLLPQQVLQCSMQTGMGHPTHADKDALALSVVALGAHVDLVRSQLQAGKTSKPAGVLRLYQQGLVCCNGGAG